MSVFRGAVQLQEAFALVRSVGLEGSMRLRATGLRHSSFASRVPCFAGRFHFFFALAVGSTPTTVTIIKALPLGQGFYNGAVSGT